MSGAAETLAALRTAVARIEAESAGRSRGPRRIALGVEAIDGMIGGGLRRGALHALSASPSGAAAATGFAAALAARAAGEGRAVLWIRQDMGAFENGEPWGPGLAEIGLDPARLVLLRAPDADAALKAAEAGLACRALAAAIVEPFGSLAKLDRVAGRRLALAAGRSGVLALLLRIGAERSQPAGLSAAETRWRIEPLSSAEIEDWGHPRAIVELVRNRLGALGRWPLEWDGDDGPFRLVEREGDVLDEPVRPAARGAPDHGGRAAEPVDRPRPQTGEVSPLRRTG